MGVVVLQAYPVPQDKSAAQVTEFIQRRIINLGAIMVKIIYHQHSLKQAMITLQEMAVFNSLHGS